MKKHNGLNGGGLNPVSWCRIALAGFILFAVYIILRGLSFSASISDSSNGKTTLPIPLEVILKGNPIELQQDDLLIRNYIWEHGYLKEASKGPYNIQNSDEDDPSVGQTNAVRQILNDMRGGFFVEAGALDGVLGSNSLYFEKLLGWKGLLVEADPKNYELLLKTNRKAWTSNACLATKSIPHEVVFQQEYNIGKIATDSSKNTSNHVLVKCFPFYSLLSALDVYTVDYFSLDVEGNELDVLMTIPFDKIFIKVLSVEYSHVPQGKAALKEFMETKGYTVASEVTHPKDWANDFIFVHKSLQRF